MKALKIILNVLGILAAIVVSFILTAVLVVTPIVSYATSYLKSDEMYESIENVVSTVVDNMPVSSDEEEVMVKVMKTELMADVIDLYVENIYADLIGTEPETVLTEEAIRAIAEAHRDEINPLVNEYVEGQIKQAFGGLEIELGDVELKLMVDEVIDGMVPEIYSALPTLEQIGIGEDTIMIFRNVYNGIYLKSMYIYIAVFSVLIIICRFPRFKGFMWNGVVYLISAVFVLGVSLLIKGSSAMLISGMVPGDIPGVENIVIPFINGLSGELFKGAGIIALSAVVFILVFVIGRLIFVKKNNPNMEVAA